MVSGGVYSMSYSTEAKLSEWVGVGYVGGVEFVFISYRMVGDLTLACGAPEQSIPI